MGHLVYPVMVLLAGNHRPNYGSRLAYRILPNCSGFTVLSFAIAQKKEPKKRLGSHSQLFLAFGNISSLTIVSYAKFDS